jgi:DNA gyrase/topoisomerase IV subunit B
LFSRDAENELISSRRSAGGNKQGRDRTFQAILPLRGKILNVEKARIDKMLTSQEIKNLIIAMGTGVGEGMNVDKMRYHRVIIMTMPMWTVISDALHFFYRNFEEIIKRGILYRAPPLYRIRKARPLCLKRRIERLWTKRRENSRGLKQGKRKALKKLKKHKREEKNQASMFSATKVLEK